MSSAIWRSKSRLQPVTQYGHTAGSRLSGQSTAPWHSRSAFVNAVTCPPG